LAGEAFLPLGSSDVQRIVDEFTDTQSDIILNSINGDSNIAFFDALQAAEITPQEVPTISFGGPPLLRSNVA
jgi:urea transport system substrate-binding protein